MTASCCFCPLDSPAKSLLSSTSSNGFSGYPSQTLQSIRRNIQGFDYSKRSSGSSKRKGYCFRRTAPTSSSVFRIKCGILPVDPWSPTIDSQSLASQLFAGSLFPYLGFLYYITKSKTAPKLTLFGFYFLLVFVGATIPAGIYAKVHYGTSLSNVDWLHGGAESFLTLTNLFIVLGLRDALRKAQDVKQDTPQTGSETKEKQSSV